MRGPRRRRHSVREAASQVLVDRGHEPEGLRGTLAVSVAVHALAIGALMLSPGSWFAAGEEERAPNVAMAIRLGGPEGPGEGGQTPLGGRPIQRLLTLEEARRPQWIQPPTPAPPEMILPVEQAAPRPEPETEVETTPPEARGRTPTRGPELLAGNAMADTGVSGIGVGLSGGGLGGSGGEISLGDFCCPEYLNTMLQLIRRQWNSNQQVPGRTVLRFTIQRDGAIAGVAVDRSSGYFALDMSAQRAILLTNQLPGLPSAFSEPSLTVRLTFEYRR